MGARDVAHAQPGAETGQETRVQSTAPRPGEGRVAASPTGVPRILDVRFSTDAGAERWYPPRRVIEVTVKFDQPVWVDTRRGTPRIDLEMGRPPLRQTGYASIYASGSGSSKLTFRYLALDWNQDFSDPAIGANALRLHGAAISNLDFSLAADLAHAPAAAGPQNIVSTWPALADAAGPVDAATAGPATIAATGTATRIVTPLPSYDPELAAARAAAKERPRGFTLEGRLQLAERTPGVVGRNPISSALTARASEPLPNAPAVSIEHDYVPAAATGTPGAPLFYTPRPAGQSRFNLSWSREDNADIANYLVQVSADGGNTWTNLLGYDEQGDDLYHPASTYPQSNKYIHKWLEPGSTRHYRVKARTGNGVEGPWSTERDGSPPNYATTDAMVPVPACAGAFWSAEITLARHGAYDDLGYKDNNTEVDLQTTPEHLFPGLISDKEFDLGTRTFEVNQVYFGQPSEFYGFPPAYHFAVASAFSDAEIDDLTLHVGAMALPFSSVTAHSPQDYGESYRWAGNQYEGTFPYKIYDRVTVCLVDSSPGVTLKLDPASISENDETSTVTATVSRASSTPFTVTVSAAPDAPAVDGDFTLGANPVLTFVANATESSGAVTITANDNDVDAPHKTVTVAGEVVGASLRASGATLRITDDDAAPQLSLTVSPATIAEADTTAAAMITVSTGTTTFADDQTITLSFDGTAVKGTDYTVSLESLTLGLSEHSVTATVSPVNDDDDDDDETILVTATHDGSDVGTQQTITITDNDEVPGAPGLTAVAGDTKVTLTWTAPTTGTHPVTGYEYRSKSGTDDYPATWTAVPGEESATTVTVSNLTNGTEYTFTLRAVSDAGPGAAAEDSATPAVNTAPRFTTANDPQVAENTTAVLTVAATDDNAQDSLESYAVSGGADRLRFGIDAGTGALTFKAAPNFEDAQDVESSDPANAAGNNEYLVVVEVSSGTGERLKRAEQTLTVTVTDDDTEQPGTPAAPTVTTVTVSKLKVVWSAPDNAGPVIEDYDYQYRELKDPRSGDWTVVDDATSTAREVTIADLAEDTEYEVQVRAESDEGTGAWSDSGDGETSANAAPAITSVAAVEVAENTTAVVTVTASDDDDSIESYAVTGGADELRFGIDASTGALTFKAAPNFEDAQDVESTDPANAAGNNEYLVVVEVSSGRGERLKRAEQTLTVTVTDDDEEQPGTPAAPTVTTVTVSKLKVVWSAPDNAGPVIEDYDYQYRELKDPRSGDWTVVDDATSTATEVTIPDLAEDTEYEVQVRAESDEGTGAWSDSGDGETSANAAPAITSVAAVEVAENTTAVLTVTASDDDDSLESYAVTGGADELRFGIDAGTGALTFKAAPNFEDAQDVESSDPVNAAGNNEYLVVVEVSSGRGERLKRAEQTLTVRVTDDDEEQPGTPAAPTVTTVSVSKLKVVWSAPDNAGPAIEDYDYQYRELKDPRSGDWTVVDDATSTATEVTIPDLAEDTEYEVQVRAESDEGTGAWSDSGDGETSANAAPAITSVAAVEVAENTTAVVTVTASDDDDSIESYAVSGGADRLRFGIDAGTGALTFQAAPNFEDAQDVESSDPVNAAGNNEYLVVVEVSSGRGERLKRAEQTLTVTVTDDDEEQPGTPAAPTVTTVTVSKLKVVWSAPDNAGPAIEDYDYQHRELKDPRSGDWTVVDDATSTATEVTIPDLAEDTEYEVQVRAESDEGTGAWSDSGDGETSANAVPAITSAAAVEVAENTTAVVTVTASDDDDSIESYAVTGGADRLRFGIDAGTGALTFQAAPNFEDAQDVESTDPVNAAGNNEYLVVVEVSSGRGERLKRAEQTLTVTVTDDDEEQPGTPAAPTVTTVSVSKLKVVWSAPENAGPVIEDYDYQYRELKDPRSGDWTVVDDATSTATEVTIPDLAEDTEYEVQVRAESDEGSGAWSDSGDGETSANAVPAITSAAAVEVAENTTAVLTVDGGATRTTASRATR